MTARCGSTLLGQMISRTPKAFVMSEPWAWMHLHGHYIGGDIPMAAYREVIIHPSNLGLLTSITMELLRFIWLKMDLGWILTWQ